MDPAAIDLAFVPRRRAGLTTIGSGAEQIVLDQATDRPHPLSATAALVWSFIDGGASLEEFAVDLVDVLGLDPHEVRVQLVELARDLARRGLLDGFDPDMGPEPAPDQGFRRLTSPTSPGLDARFEGPDARVLTVRSPLLTFDLRSDDPALADELGAVLSSTGVDIEGPRVPEASDASAPLYSLLVSRPGAAATGLHFLYRSGRLLRRSRERADLLRIAAADVSALLAREGRDDPLLNVIAVTRGGSLVLIDPIFSSYIDDLERDLRRRGVDRLDASFITVPVADGHPHPAGLVLRTTSTRDDEALTAAAITVAAADLTRGVDGRIGPSAMARLLDVVAAPSPIVRVPGRHDLRAAILSLLPPMP